MGQEYVKKKNDSANKWLSDAEALIDRLAATRPRAPDTYPRPGVDDAISEFFSLTAAWQDTSIVEADALRTRRPAGVPSAANASFERRLLLLLDKGELELGYGAGNFAGVVREAQRQASDEAERRRKRKYESATVSRNPDQILR